MCCPVKAKPERPGQVISGGAAYVIVPGELVELSRELAGYGVPKLIPAENPARLHSEGERIEIEAKLWRVDGKAMVSGPLPRCVVARVNVEVLWDAAAELSKVIEAELSCTPEIVELLAPRRAGLLSASDLARMNDVDPERLRKALERWRLKHFDGGWHEVTDRRPREPQYLYDPEAVANVIARLKQ